MNARRNLQARKRRRRRQQRWEQDRLNLLHFQALADTLAQVAEKGHVAARALRDMGVSFREFGFAMRFLRLAWEYDSLSDTVVFKKLTVH